MLGYRSTAAGLRMLRHRTVYPTEVIVDSSPRSRLPGCDVAGRAHRVGRFRVGRHRSAALQARGPVEPARLSPPLAAPA